MRLFDLTTQQTPQDGPSPIALAQLTPQQGAAALSAMSGRALGDAAAGLFRGALGMRTERERIEAARAEVARRTAGMTDQVDILRVAIQVLSQFGFPEQAAEAARVLEDTLNKRRDDERAAKKDAAADENAKRRLAILERGSAEQQLIQRYADELAELDALNAGSREYNRQAILVREIGNRLAKKNIKAVDRGGHIEVFLNGEFVATYEKTLDPNKVAASRSTSSGGAEARGSRKVPVKDMMDDQGRQVYQDANGDLFVLGEDGWEQVDGGVSRNPNSGLSAAARMRLGENDATIATAIRVLKMLDSAENREALGPKAYLNNLGELLNRLQTAGVDVRAEITNLMSSYLHSRSGAAVTVQEFDRLRPFLPQQTDNAEMAIRKLRSLIRVAIDLSNELRRAFDAPPRDYDVPAPGGSAGGADPGVVVKSARRPAQAQAAATSGAESADEKVYFPRTKTEYDRDVPPGKLFRDPRDGKIYRKPRNP